MTPEPPRCTVWRPAPAPSWPQKQKLWLTRPGALTQGLRELGDVHLRVMREQACGLQASEAWMVSGPPGTAAWLREIVMAVDGRDCVFARSFTPLAASHSWWQGMRVLRTRPLADMLYQDPEITRSPFHVCRLSAQQPLYHTAQRLFGRHCPRPRELYARFSVFWRNARPLVVAECFLPEFWRLV